jgi:hypothetical protein
VNVDSPSQLSYLPSPPKDQDSNPQGFPSSGIRVDALSRRYALLTQLDYKIFGLETTKDQCVHDADFKDVFLHYKDGKTWNKFVFNDGFVF